MKEIEVKAAISNHEYFLEKAQEYGFVFASPVVQRDVIFLPEGIDFLDIKPGIPVVRVRNQNNQKKTLTLKKRVLNELDKIEHEIVIDDDLEAEEILRQLNFHEVVRVNKNRREGHCQDLTICLDEIDGLGLFVEVEKLCANGDGLSIQEELFCLLETFGIKRDDRITSGYDTLMYNKLH